MAKAAANKELRGKKDRQGKKRRLARMSHAVDVGTKRRARKLGVKRPKGFEGSVVHYVSRQRAMKQLQVTLRDFRRLCILKGIYPRVPPKLPKGGANKTFYAAKDIAFLTHEPVLAKFREHKALMKKVARLLGRGEENEARSLYASRPRYSLDHLVRERYPTFDAALADMDDALTLVHLFAHLPAEPGVMDVDHGKLCARLVREWQYYVAKTRTLRKVFCSIKGMYYTAEVRGVKITWIAPHKFTQELPRDKVDFRVMRTFLEFFETSLSFVLFKLYADDLASAYPPNIVVEEDAGGAFLSAVREIALGGASSTKSSGAGEKGEGVDGAGVANGNGAANGNGNGTGKGDETDAKARKLAAVLAKAGLKAAKGAAAAQDDEEEEEEEDAPPPAAKNKNNEDDASGMDAFAEDESARAVRDHAEQAEKLTQLFVGACFWLGREVPLEPMELCVLSFGGHVVRQDLGVDAADARVTHVVTDRPNVVMRDDKEYVQPQWVFDCINAGMLLPTSGYHPGESLPPHLSPYVDDDAVGYRPARADEIEALRTARAAGGGTEKLLQKAGLVKAAPAAKAEEEEEEEGSEESESEEEKEPAEEEEEEESEEDEAEALAPPSRAEAKLRRETDPSVWSDVAAAGKAKAAGATSSAREEKEADEEKPRASKPSFIPADAFAGAMPGYFFRRGERGLGYYRDTTATLASEFDVERSIKSEAKAQLKNEAKEGNEMRTILMSQKAKDLYHRLKRGQEMKQEGVNKLVKRRKDLEAKAGGGGAS